MKSHGYLVTLSILMLFPACRSHSIHTNAITKTESKENKEAKVQELLTLETQYLETKNTKSDIRINEEIVLASYDPNGKLQTIQTTRRNTGRNELADSSKQRSENSQLDKNTKIKVQSRKKIQLNEKKDSKKDSRLIQGGQEWTATFIFIGAMIGIIFGLIKGRKK